MKTNHTLLNLLRKKTIDEFDRQLACDYVDYYGIEPAEYAEYADEFVSVCYTFNEETGEHEPRPIDQLPFSDVVYEDNDFITYEYGDQKITKCKKNFY